MLSIGWGEMIVIAVVALVVVGPDRWPELARTLGGFYSKIRQATFEVRQTITTEMDLLKSQIDPADRTDEVRQTITTEMNLLKSQIDPADQNGPQEKSSSPPDQTPAPRPPSDISRPPRSKDRS